MRTIIRHVLPAATGEVSVQGPQGAEVLSLGCDFLGRPCVYLLVDLDRPAVWRRLHVHEQGGRTDGCEIPDGAVRGNYKGSVTTRAGAELHLFDLGER